MMDVNKQTYWFNALRKDDVTSETFYAVRLLQSVTIEQVIRQITPNE